MTQRQVTNHKSNNLLILVGGIRMLPEIILKFRHLKYRRSVILAVYRTIFSYEFPFTWFLIRVLITTTEILMEEEKKD